MKLKLDEFLIAGIQMDIKPGDPERNFQRAIELLERAADRGAKLASLPELMITGFDYDFIRGHAKPIPNTEIQILCDKAKELKMCLVAGSIAERRTDGIYNTSLFIDDSGRVLGKYSKVHLFPLMGENVHFKGGKNPSPIFHTKYGKIGMMICYDLRFPELARRLTLEGAEILVIPSEWPHPRIDHWMTLIKARAIENQIYVLAVNRVGKDKTGSYFGATSIIDPWGNPLASSGDEEGVVMAPINLSMIPRVRSKIPSLNSRVEEAYR
ncbi:MAG: carbon-nitrogen family hydrolase [Nitrososphaerota archaeon]|nr:carbon-nitrogen family hydrolase [Nitrososphaerota archaeon]